MAYAQESITPYGTAATKTAQVEQMFDNIAPTYDALNHGMSLGIDRYWRRQTLRALHLSMAHDGPPSHLLDIATGTGDFAIEAARRLQPRTITAIDLSARMIDVARHKVSRARLDNVISLQQGDCTDLPMADATFDAVTVAFGVRNFEDLDGALRQINRVLKRGGRLAIVELSRPRHTPMRQLFTLYAHTVLPLCGRLFPRDERAYSYLAGSIEAFPQAETMAAVLAKAGFTAVSYRRMTLGLCTRYIATK